MNSTRFVFSWEPSYDPDGDKISEYHFFLSAREDMAWPLSGYFEQIAIEENSFEIKYDGMLNNDTTYYWRVRSVDERGVLSEWSDTWQFIPHGPNVPLDLHFKTPVSISWKPNPSGRSPIYYEIYGSNIHSFEPSIENYELLVSRKPKRESIIVPGNWIANTTSNEFQVIQEPPVYPNQNSYYYRVIAVDENGVRSGPAYIASEKMWIYSQPVEKGEIGKLYQYQARTIFTILNIDYSTKTRMPYGENVLLYKLLEAPEWLQIEASTGLLSGIPSTASEFQRVHIEVSNILNQEKANQVYWITVE